jgi:coproporphyrinogen III oxidase-like Fe-S oxidoreductase
MNVPMTAPRPATAPLPSAIDLPRQDLAGRLAGSAFQGYTYGYPHKTTYRRLAQPRRLRDVWSSEPKQALDLYLHIPYCEMRCGFCNLFTAVNTDTDAIARMLDQMSQEAEVAADAIGAARFARMAIGGGTPTILSADQLDRFLGRATARLGVRPAEVPASVEASPETVDADKLAVLKSYGVSRLSLGVQSFDDGEARALGRPQRRHAVEGALALIKDTRFETLNIDLIYGAEGQTTARWLASIEAALAWEPEEICLYPLYVRPLTGLARSRDGDMWADDQRLELYRVGRERLAAAGFAPANMRLFRRTGLAADLARRHKSLTDGTVGVGCGARSVTSALHYSTEYAVGRFGVKQILAEYLARQSDTFAYAHYGVALDAADRRRRHVILHLMEADGISRHAYRLGFGEDALGDFPELSLLVEHGFATIDPARIRLTAEGLERSDVIGPWLYDRDVQARMEAYAWR